MIDAKTRHFLEDLAYDYTIGCGNTEEENPPERLLKRLSFYLKRPSTDEEKQHFTREWHRCVQQAAQP